MNIGKEMYEWASDLFPICRSITGEGVRETLNYINNVLPDLVIHEVKSGTKVFDWKVPKEWSVREAWIKDETGKKIVDFTKNNLHLVGYSHPIDKWVNLDQLQEILHSLPNKPNAIPYVTSYYKEYSGFCITENDRKKLKNIKYHLYIDSSIKDGNLNYGELIVPGKSKQEIFISTYICHPSMANNEISGPVVSMAIAKLITSIPNNKYTYRFIFIPETIGSITYLSKNYKILKENVYAGFNISCVGDNRAYSFLPSRNGKTISDRAAKHVLKYNTKSFIEYTWLDRGSDERQYCAPGIDLPIASIMRTKYGEYPEYHTSDDNMSLISPSGLQGAYENIALSIELIEKNNFYISTVLCEPMLGPRGLYDIGSNDKSSSLVNFLSYADGKKDLIDIAEILDIPAWDLFEIVDKLMENKLIKTNII
tara:strand:- start:1286 stop:2557 length:1272 start_codon:yes stop_codon:yes gene_type:complete